LNERQAQEILTLLREIRDLLVPIAEEYRPKYEQRQTVVRTMYKIISSKQRMRMYELMDGTQSQTDIAEKIGVEPSTVSRFVQVLKKNNLVEVEEGSVRRPKAKHPLDWLQD
jgi:DNA-binding MarR family transcriptional regulator